MDDLSKYSGEEHMQRAPQLVTNVLRLNGKNGQFELIKVKDGQKEDENGKRKYPVEKLGQQVDVNFLRIRRKLTEKMKGKPGPGTPRPASSNEHNHKGERLVLYTSNGAEYGTSDDLRVRYPDLRTQQIVYALYHNELVRLTVKGASLGSQAKARDVMDFYTYIASFKNNPEARDGVKDHFYDFMTELHAVEESSELGDYYAISFKRGHANSPEAMEQVAAAMKAVHDFVTESDDYYEGRIMDKAVAPEEVPTIQMDEEAADEEFNQLVADTGEQTGDIPF